MCFIILANVAVKVLLVVNAMKSSPLTLEQTQRNQTYNRRQNSHCYASKEGRVLLCLHGPGQPLLHLFLKLVYIVLVVCVLIHLLSALS